MNYATVNEWLADGYAWNIYHEEDVYSIRYMGNKELAESIVEDLLQLTFYEKRNKVNVNFDFNTLVRFLKSPGDIQRVKDIFETEVVQKFITIVGNNQVRIKDDRDTQQAAMDFCGSWMEGFDVPDEPGIIKVNNEVLEEKINTHGGIDNLAKALAMEINATHEVSKVVN